MNPTTNTPRTVDGFAACADCGSPHARRIEFANGAHVHECMNCGERRTDLDPNETETEMNATNETETPTETAPTGDEFGKLSGDGVAAILKVARVKQAAVAVAAGTSQGTVSRRIANDDLYDVTGTDVRRAAVRLAIDGAGIENCRRRLATPAPTPTPTPTVYTTQAAAVARQFGPTPTATPAPTVAPVIVSPSVSIQTADIPSAEIREFDSAIFKVAQMLRRAIDQGDARMTFGLRKLVNAKRSYMHFRRASFDHGQAAAAAYYVSVSAREYGETEKVAVESFRAVFTTATGRGPTDPGSILESASDLPGSEFDLPDEHPAFRILRPVLNAGENVWAFGPTGGGKTFGMMQHFRTRRGVRPIRMQCNANTVHAHIVGTFGLRANNGATETVFEYASIPHAMSAAIRGDDSARGLPCIVDEISLADSGALMTLQAVLEGEPLTISENGGETIFPDPGFQLIACDNTRGLGEAVAYVATLPVNEAFRDRFLFCEVGYSPNEKNIIRATV